MFEKIEKLQYFIKNKMSKTLILWVILILIIAGYASFFAISAIMPEVQSSELYLTQFNEWEDAGFGRNVAVKSWDYDEDDSAMAVIISYSGAANQTVQTEYMAMYRNKNNQSDSIEAEAVYTSNTYNVIILRDIPSDFKEIALGVTSTAETVSEEEQAENEQSVVTLYTNFEVVDRVQDVNLNSLTDVMVRLLNGDISSYTEELEQTNSLIAETEEKIGLLSDTIETYNNDILYATSEEVTEIRNEIQDLENQRDNLYEELAEYENEKTVIEGKVSEANEKIQEIQSGNLVISETEPSKPEVSSETIQNTN